MKVVFDNWQLRALNNHKVHNLNGMLEATVPGCVHTDLLAHDLIPDPYLDLNENDLKWIGETDWEYSTTFDLSAELLNHEKLELVCEGLDTLATLFVNDKEIAKTFNMHRAYTFDLKAFVTEGANQLSIVFTAPLIWTADKEKELGALPNASIGLPFNFIRKMACNFGWDWGPKVTTSGIWQPIYIRAWNIAKLTSVRPLISLSDDLSEAELNVHAGVESALEESLAELHICLTSPQGKCLYEGRDTKLKLDHPELWWPVGHGEQPLYTLQLELRHEGQILDQWKKRIAFRKLELDSSLDDIGSAFTFVINNKAIFAKGANWIPDDCFPTRVDKSRYEARIRQAVDANMNMLRVWGGGIYEQEDFYDTCDDLGVMVWQDFLFACAAYPEEEPYWSEVKAEAEYQVARLSSHVSLVLWNGNNENIWGYFSWDWQSQLQERTWGNAYYQTLLPQITAALDPTRPYWPGSPYSGSMDIHPLADHHGCKHIWDAWNQTDYDIYRSYVPRFVSEFGHQAPPSFATMLESISERPLAPESPAMLHHQKATDGNNKLHKRLSEHFDIPEDIHLWHYATQLNQARAIDYGVSHWRSMAPTCMGTLYWQLNDCWPVTSWAAIDGYGRKKAFWYATRKFYADQFVTIQPRGDKLALCVVNDSDELWQDDFVVTRYNFAAEVLESIKVQVIVAARASEELLLSENFMPHEKAQEFLKASASATQAFYFFDVDKRLDYPAADYRTDIQKTDTGYSVQVTAKSFLRDLVFYGDKLEPNAEVSDQLITLLPNESYRFEVIAEQLPTVKSIVKARALLCANDLTRRV